MKVRRDHLPMMPGYFQEEWLESLEFEVAMTGLLRSVPDGRKLHVTVEKSDHRNQVEVTVADVYGYEITFHLIKKRSGSGNWELVPISDLQPPL